MIDHLRLISNSYTYSISRISWITVTGNPVENPRISAGLGWCHQIVLLSVFWWLSWFNHLGHSNCLCWPYTVPVPDIVMWLAGLAPLNLKLTASIREGKYRWTWLAGGNVRIYQHELRLYHLQCGQIKSTARTFLASFLIKGLMQSFKMCIDDTGL